MNLSTSKVASQTFLVLAIALPRFTMGIAHLSQALSMATVAVHKSAQIRKKQQQTQVIKTYLIIQ